MDNSNNLMSWPDFQEATRKADALWMILNADERQAISDNVAMPVDVAVQLMQKVLQNKYIDVQFWAIAVGTGSAIEFRRRRQDGSIVTYLHEFGSVIESLSGSIITDIILAVANFYEKYPII